MKAIIDDDVWYEAWLDTPLGVAKTLPRHKNAARPEDVADAPGVHLKSLVLTDGGWPRWFGRLLSFAPDEVVVVSKCDATTNMLRCVWRGTPAEYEAMWEVD